MMAILGWLLIGVGASAMLVGVALEESFAAIAWGGLVSGVVLLILDYTVRQMRAVRLSRQARKEYEATTAMVQPVAQPGSYTETYSTGSYTAGSYGASAYGEPTVRSGQLGQAPSDYGSAGYGSAGYGSTGYGATYEPIQGEPPRSKHSRTQLLPPKVVLIGSLIAFLAGGASMFVVEREALGQHYAKPSQVWATLVPVRSEPIGGGEYTMHYSPIGTRPMEPLIGWDAQLVCEEFMELAGTDQALEISLMDDQARGIFLGPDGGENLQEVQYTHRDHFQLKDSASSTQNQPFSVTQVDRDVLDDIWERMPDELGYDAFKLDYWPSVTLSAEGYLITLYDGFKGVAAQYSFDGELVDVVES